MVHLASLFRGWCSGSWVFRRRIHSALLHEPRTACCRLQTGEAEVTRPFSPRLLVAKLVVDLFGLGMLLVVFYLSIKVGLLFQSFRELRDHVVVCRTRLHQITMVII